MAKSAIRYRLLPGTAGKKMVDASAFSPKGLTALIREITLRGRNNIVKRTPVGHFGALRGGYSVEVKRANTKHPIGVIANPIIYHDAVEEGRKAGRPPPTAVLIPWVGSKLGIPPGPKRESVAFLVARKIGRTGTDAQKMVEKGWDDTRKEIKPRLKKLGFRIMAKLK